ncbi:putative protein phosphatase 2C 80 [Escovopsis weberi]|uniref:Protein phosphatase n=1 Tax=Escovopsis weberi TaxID=150374 RepID=A0A0M9VU23_ESCWE|nr:putative protein phosphatase 2C 80 [Escovopsis weberi]
MSRVRRVHLLPGSPTILRDAHFPRRGLFRELFRELPPWRGWFSSTRWVSSSAPTPTSAQNGKPPFRFETGIGLFAKRTPRPFPPPFLSPPSISFSDPLSTHDRSRDRRAFVNGELIRGVTNGDDAVYASKQFICANDGVGAWAARHRGHPGLWSRLILHFWSLAVEQESSRAVSQKEASRTPDPVATLQAAYEQTREATQEHDWQGTTTTCGAQLHYRYRPAAGGGGGAGRGEPAPQLYVTNLGDGQVLVLRPRDHKIVYRSEAQWHWFDCPRQLGTNSPDTPQENAVLDVVDVEVGDVVLAMSDGVVDNLWEHEIAAHVFKSVDSWETGRGGSPRGGQGGQGGGEEGEERMEAMAHDLVKAAKAIAIDPFAESPYMGHAIEEGLASEGGKLDDISVVAAICVKNS